MVYRWRLVSCSPAGDFHASPTFHQYQADLRTILTRVTIRPILWEAAIHGNDFRLNLSGSADHATILVEQYPRGPRPGGAGGAIELGPAEFLATVTAAIGLTAHHQLWVLSQALHRSPDSYLASLPRDLMEYMILDYLG